MSRIAHAAGTPWRVPASLLAVVLVLATGPALAQSEAIATAPSAPADPARAAHPPLRSEVMVINLIHLMVKQGLITQAAADSLIQQAAAETQQAEQGAAAPAEGDISVTYVPEVVRNQIRDEVKTDVMAKAEAEGWASPHGLPSWLGKIQLFGDLRFRDEFDLYSANNISPYINYNGFNTNGPTDINANTNPNGLPFLNTRQNRIDQLSIRARFGVKFEPADWVSMTFRLGSGQDSGPVSLTQLLGNDLIKKDVWLDQAYITLSPGKLGSLNFGRMPDLFMHTDLLFDDNLEFDGVMALTEQPVGSEGLRLFGAAGAFPLGYVGASFPTNSGQKAPDSTKWLYAVQAGARYQPGETSWSVRGAVSLYDFENVAGQLSAPCPLYDGIKQCSTDPSAPAYMQKGNTLFLIRDITPNPATPLSYAQPQFVGLSYNYRELDVMAEFEAPMFGSARGQLTADYVRNLAYDPARILANPLTPPITNTNASAAGGVGIYQSGNNAYNVRATVGQLHPSARGDWNFQIGYKYIEPDAVIDAFNSNDFNQGGTNTKGYYLIANYYLAKNTWVDTRWFAATQVYGPPLTIDVLQLELQSRF